MSERGDQLLRLLAIGSNDIEEWRLADPGVAAAKGYPRVFPAPVLDDWGIVFVDVTIDATTGEPVCHEVNGPNAVGSDALTGDSLQRASFEARQALRRAEEREHLVDGRFRRPVVTVHAHQHWSAFRTAGEFYPRVGRFADELEAQVDGARIELRGGADELGDEDVSVVLGDVPSVTAHLTVDPATGRFEYRGRPVVFIGNPNVLSELVRTGVAPAEPDAQERLDLRVFHAWRLVTTVHDKALQQDLFAGTGIRPLDHFESPTRERALLAAREMLATGPVVLKPNGTSGGAGVHVVVPGMTDDEVRARVDAVIDDCVAKYGDNAATSVLPIRGFEFVQSTGYSMADGGHLWDLRIAVLFEPGTAHVFPVTLRIAPAAFDERAFAHDRDQWVSNVSGRDVTLLKSGLDDAALAAVGMTPALLDGVFDASVRWTMKAWDCSQRGGGPQGVVYEDVCENDDVSFYPREKFVPRERLTR